MKLINKRISDTLIYTKFVTVETQNIFSEKDCTQNINKLFVFGENQKSKWKEYIFAGGGQALIRPCANSVGICTLADIGNYWKDSNFSDNLFQIEKDIFEIKSFFIGDMFEFTHLVFPENGLGTGRAEMQKNCPKTFFYLCNRLLEEFNFNNTASLQSKNF